MSERHSIYRLLSTIFIRPGQQIRLGVTLAVMTILSSVSVAGVNAQCTDNFTEADKARGFIEAKEKPEETKYTHILVEITTNVRFKIALAGDITSAFSKANDYVPFTVAENVYGTTKTDPKKRCVVIPKDTKIYGLVDFAHARYPFNIGGKAKVFVTVRDFTMENGTLVRIKFVEPPMYGTPEEPFKDVFRDCRRYPTRKCIAGRRDKLAFPTEIISAGASVGLLGLTKDDTTGAVAGLSFIDSVGKVSGVDSLINPPNAQLKDKMIFDVETEGVSAKDSIAVWLPVKPEEPKKPAEEDKKKP